MGHKSDRVMSVFNGEKPDRVPIFECVAHDRVLEHFGGKPVGVGDFEGVIRACSQFLDLCHPALVPREPAVIENKDGTRTTIERWTSWTSHRQIDPDDVPKVLQEEIEQAGAWKPEQKMILEWRRTAIEAAKYCDDMIYINYGTSVPICPLDLEQGFYALADHPELVREWNHVVNDRKLREMDVRADSKYNPVCILWNDIASKGGLIYPPTLLEEFFYPHLRRQIDLLHSRGLKVLFHSDGDVTKALPELIRCGIDAFNPLEISAGMKPEDFKEISGGKVILVGGVDGVGILAQGKPQEVAAETKSLIDLFVDDGNLIIASATGEIDESMPLENVLAMYETVWKYGKY